MAQEVVIIFGEVEFASNYGWKDIAWGGKEYYGLGIEILVFDGKYKNL